MEDEGFLDGLVKEYDANGTSVCVLTPWENRKTVLDAAKKHPDCIIPFGNVKLGIDPPSRVTEYHELGFKGLKCTTPVKNYDDKSFYPTYQKAQEYRMVILFHTGFVGRMATEEEGEGAFWEKGGDISNDRMRPVYLDTIARAFPKLILIGAHLGIPWYMEAGDAARWNPNLFFDISGMIDVYFEPGWFGFSGNVSGARGGREEGKKKVLFWLDQALWWEGAWDSIVFGTDVMSPEFRQRERNKYYEVMQALKLSREEQDKVMGLNIRKYLE